MLLTSGRCADGMQHGGSSNSMLLVSRLTHKSPSICVADPDQQVRRRPTSHHDRSCGGHRCRLRLQGPLRDHWRNAVRTLCPGHGKLLLCSVFLLLRWCVCRPGVCTQDRACCSAYALHCRLVSPDPTLRAVALWRRIQQQLTCSVLVDGTGWHHRHTPAHRLHSASRHRDCQRRRHGAQSPLCPAACRMAKGATVTHLLQQALRCCSGGHAAMCCGS